MRRMRDRFFFYMLTVLFLSAGCGGSYNAEKAFWHADREYAGVYQDPKTAPGEDFARSIDALRNIVLKYPAWDKSALIQFNMGNMYLIRGEKEKAKEEFNKVIVNYPEKADLCARAMYHIGATYEEKRDWDSALGYYKNIIDKYPGTFIGLQIPIYIAEHYIKTGRRDEGKKEYDHAIRGYMRSIEQNPYSKQVPVIQYFLMLGYGNQGKWNDLLATLKNIADKYPDSEGAPIALYRMAAIYARILDKPDKAEAVYRKIIADYPKSKLEKNVQFKIGNLSLIKGDVDKAAERFEDIQDQYPEDTLLGARAQFMIASGYERSGRWADAYREYKELQDKYPRSPEALKVPIIVGMHHKNKGENEEAEAAFKKAVSFYGGLVKENPRKRIAVLSLDHMAQVYFLEENWQEAVDTLNELIDAYPADPLASNALLKIASIYETGFKDNKKAKEAYSSFLNKYPGHALSNIAIRKIKTL